MAAGKDRDRETLDQVTAQITAALKQIRDRHAPELRDSVVVQASSASSLPSPASDVGGTTGKHG